MAITLNGTTGITTPALDSDGTLIADGLTIAGATSLTGNLTVDGGTIKLDGNYPVGSQNLGMGDTALGVLDAAGYYNVAFGPRALSTQTTGNSNTAVGQDAMRYNQTSSNNSAFGTYALGASTTGSNNVALGRSALAANTTASNNTAVGYQAGYSNSSSGPHTFLGYRAGYNNTGGSYNTFVGADSGYAVTTGSKNTILGVYNGNQGGLDIRTASNYIVLSDGDGNPRLFINGSGNINSADTYTHGMSGTIRAMYVRSDGYFGYNVSIRASKTNIKDISDASWLLQLEPKSFNYRVQNADGTYSDEAVETLSYGLIAEEVEAVNPELCYYDEVDGTPELKGVGYSELITPILKLVQQQQATITALTARITALEGN